MFPRIVRIIERTDTFDVARCLLTRLHADAVTSIPVCLLYPWPWWQANKTPRPAIQDSDDPSVLESPSHYNHYNGTPLIRPLERINDFILKPDGATPLSVAVAYHVVSRPSLDDRSLLSCVFSRKIASRDSSRSTPIAREGDGEWMKSGRDLQNRVIHFKLSRVDVRRATWVLSLSDRWGVSAIRDAINYRAGMAWKLWQACLRSVCERRVPSSLGLGLLRLRLSLACTTRDLDMIEKCTI